MVEICLTKVLMVSIVLQIILVAIICKLLSHLNKASLKDDLELPEGVVESGKISQEDFDKARKNAIKKKLSKYDY